MKNLLFNSIILAILLLTVSCKTAYVADDFEMVSVDHVKIAVLPIEMNYTGKFHQNWTEDQILRNTYNESMLFQSAMTNEILRNTGRKGMRVSVLPASTINGTLEAAGIDLLAATNVPAKELTELLGVDALVIGQIVKDQQFSDGISAGADIAGDVIADVVGDLFGTAGRIIKNNKNVFANYKLVNGETGTILWSADCSTTFDWKTQHQEVIRSTTRRISRQFPYRNR